MKNLILYGGVVTTILLVVFSIYFEIRREWRQAITAVIDQAHVANLNAHRTITLKNGRSATNFAMKVYVGEIEKIPTSRCPKDFRLAWLNYVQTCERLQLPLHGLGAAAEFDVSVLQGSSSGTEDALKRLDRMNVKEAWMNVETVALNDGVQIVRP